MFATDLDYTSNRAIRADDIRTTTHLLKKRQMQMLARFGPNGTAAIIDTVGMKVARMSGNGISQIIPGTTYCVIRFLANAGINSYRQYLDVPTGTPINILAATWTLGTLTLAVTNPVNPFTGMNLAGRPLVITGGTGWTTGPHNTVIISSNTASNLVVETALSITDGATNVTGNVPTLGGIVRTGFNAVCLFTIQTGITHTNYRMWVGLTTADLHTVGNPTAASVCAFRYDSAVDGGTVGAGTATWHAVTSDGAGNVQTTDTLVVIGSTIAATGFRFIILTSTTTITFLINDVVVATHSTVVPPNVDLGHTVSVTTFDAVNKRIEWGRSAYMHTEFNL